MDLVDYHIHTELCGHAKGSADDYIQEAVKKNLKEIGFSDHAPLPENLRKGITMLPEETELYIKLIEEKRQQYKDKIEIKIGFEIDFPIMESLDRKYLHDPRLDYLIGSCHFLGDWAFDSPRGVDEFKNRDIDQAYKEYYKIISKLIQSGLFNIVAHFDLMKKFGHRPTIDLTHIIENLASSVSKNKNMAIEINTAGLRKPVEEIYPADNIIEIFYKMNTPITLGSDSHNPDEVGYYFIAAIEKIQGAGYRKICGFSKKRRYDIIL
jgi:histidinol-phosphatase (PHP family)